MSENSECFTVHYPLKSISNMVDVNISFVVRNILIEGSTYRRYESRVKVCVHNQSLAGGWRGPRLTNSGGRGERRLQPGHYNSINKCKLSVISLINYIFIMQLKLRPEFPVNKVSLLSICFQSRPSQLR